MKLKNLLASGCAALALSATIHAAPLSSTLDAPSAVLLAFRATGDAATGANTFLFAALGTETNGSQWNSIASQTFTLGSQLSTQFGADWYSNGNIRWGLYGITASEDVIDGAVRYGVTRVGTTTDAPISLADGDFNKVVETANQLDTAKLNLTASGTVTSTLAGIEYGTLSGADAATALLIAPAFRGFLNNQSGSYPAEFDLSQITTLKINQFLPNEDFSGFGFYADLGTISIGGDGLVTVTAVPEPSTYALMGVGAMLLIMMSRRRKVA